MIISQLEPTKKELYYRERSKREGGIAGVREIELGSARYRELVADSSASSARASASVGFAL